MPTGIWASGNSSSPAGTPVTPSATEARNSTLPPRSETSNPSKVISAPSGIDDEFSIIDALISGTNENPLIDLKSDGIVTDMDSELNVTAFDALCRTANSTSDMPVGTSASIIPGSHAQSTAPEASYAYYYPAVQFPSMTPQSPAKLVTPQPLQPSPAGTFTLPNPKAQIPSLYPTGQQVVPTAYTTPAASSHTDWDNRTPQPLSITYQPSVPILASKSTYFTTQYPPIPNPYQPSQSVVRNYGSGGCAICGASASGTHYGVLSCDGCRTFFGKSVRKGVQYVCPGNANCPIDRNQPLKCQYCRFKRCLEAGMRKEAVQCDRGGVSWRSHSSAFSDCEQLNASSASTSSVCSFEGSASVAKPQWVNPSLVSAVEQIYLAETLVLEVPPADTPEESPIFTEVSCEDYSTSRSNDANETVVNLILWCRKIPYFSNFPDADQFTLLKSCCIELLLVHFAFRLAHSLSSESPFTAPASSVAPPTVSASLPAKMTESAPPVTPKDPSFSLKTPFRVTNIFFPFETDSAGLVFNLQAERDIRGLMRWPENRLLVNLFPRDKGDVGVGIYSNELNAQCLSRRLILRRLFDLARQLKELRVSVVEVGCLRLLILLNPGIPGLSEDLRKQVESTRDAAFVCLEHVCRQLCPSAPRGRAGQLSISIANLSVVADRIRSKTSSQFPICQFLIELVSCFYQDGSA